MAIRNTQADYVLFGCNPNPPPSANTKASWNDLSGRTYDILTEREDYWPDPTGAWSIACNIDKIVPGTVGFIIYHDGSHGRIVGVIVLNGETSVEREKHGDITYARGELWRLPAEYWVDGARIKLHHKWSGRAPFGAQSRFRNGESLNDSDAGIILDELHPAAQSWIELQVANMRALAELADELADR